MTKKKITAQTVNAEKLKEIGFDSFKAILKGYNPDLVETLTEAQAKKVFEDATGEKVILLTKKIEDNGKL